MSTPLSLFPDVVEKDPVTLGVIAEGSSAKTIAESLLDTSGNPCIDFDSGCPLRLNASQQAGRKRYV
ncbi:MAG: hypothetical protein V1929_11365 [bacterium]